MSLRAHADDLRAGARSIESASATMRWHSTAAAAFRSRALRAVVMLRAAAAGLDHAAAALDRHAGAVVAELAMAERTAAAVAHGAADAVGVVSSTLHRLGL